MSLLEPPDLYPAYKDVPAFQLLDVRAPVEVARGAMPFAAYGPILSDEERHEVGIRYRQAGQDEAVALGYDLTDAVMDERVRAWREVCEAGPTAVMCWRGGMRSKLATEFIGRADVPRVRGGYKALRNYVMGELETSLAKKEAYVIGGMTGSGKTALLHDLSGQKDILALDLEGEAKHRGSAFGSLLEPQSAQATFENSLAVKLLLSSQRVLLLEDESRNIGHRQLPEPIFQAISEGPVILVEESVASRVNQIHQDYVLSLSDAHGVEATKTYLQESLLRLKKRLSAEVVARGVKGLEAAQSAWADPSAHTWIEPLLSEYYDPLYRKGLKTMNRPVIFRGSREECKLWIRSLTSR